MAKTSKYYKKNPTAAAKRRKQQARYNKTPKGLAIRVNANKLNKKLGRLISLKFFSIYFFIQYNI